MWGSETAFNYAMNAFFPLVAVPILMAWAPIAFLFTAARQALASAMPQTRWPPRLVVVITGASSGIGEVRGGGQGRKKEGKEGLGAEGCQEEGKEGNS